MDFSFVDLSPEEALGYIRSIFDTTREALVIIDEERNVRAANRAFYNMTGLAQASVVDVSLFELNEGQWNDRDLRARLDLAFGGAAAFVDFRLEIDAADGVRRTMLVSGRRLQYEKPRFGPTVLLAVQDITDLECTRSAFLELQEELEERVRRRTAELASANAELEAFAYSISHDLRAPLRALSGFSRALVEDYESELRGEAKQYLEYIQEGAQQMSRLIDDLLDLSRITRAEMRYDQVDLGAIASAILHELAFDDTDRRVDFAVADGLHVQGDEVLLTAVLRNLLGNAWKYTSRTERAVITLTADTNNGRAVYTVRDNGAGFDMCYVDKLFQPFQRLHSAMEFEGNGIGLASAYRIIRRHGGEMWAEGTVGAGAAVSFTLGDAGPSSEPTTSSNYTQTTTENCV